MRVLSADWVLPVEGAPIENGAVALEDGRIAAVGTAAELGEGERFEGAAILPGFVNAHTHLEYAVYAGFGDGFAFAPWLALHIERKDRLAPGDHEAIARLGAAECLRNGVTTIADSSWSGAAAAACDELGLRAIVYLEVFGSDPAASLERFHALCERLAPHWSERIRVGIGPHAPYSVSADVYEACFATGLPVTTHISESPAELEFILHGTGPMEPLAHMMARPAGTTGTRLLHGLGLLDGRLIAAHCVQVDDEEISLLASAGTGVAHCPRSNALLGCGIAPVGELREAGVRLGLGTDSPASTPSFDVFEELRTAIVVARARAQRPDALSAAEALELATLGSARALRLDGEIGSLVPGKRADLAVVSLEHTPYVPWEDPATAVVFGGSPSCVLATLVDGEERYRKEVFEWQKLRSAAANARSRMLAASITAPAAAGT